MTEAANRLGAALEARRIQLGMSKAELARRAHISESYVYKAISGTVQLGQDACRRLDGALGWPTGTIEEIVAGGEPPADAVSDPDRLARLEAQLARHDTDLAAVNVAVDQLCDEIARLTGLLRGLADGGK